MTKTRVIHSDPDILSGRPVFVGTRVPFTTLIEYLTGPGLEEFLDNFPSVAREQAVLAIEQSGEALLSELRPAMAELNLSVVGSVDELHSLLSEVLRFPGWYGRNWNAFWDAISGLAPMPQRLRFWGWQAFVERFPIDAAELKSCLEDYAAAKDLPSMEVEYV